MDVRYQVFVSSTFVDLKDERSAVIQTLMEMDCIPAGMELFPAMDEEQWNFIKRVIDDCDYYILILGGRYGSISSTGVSYTEMEYDYAIEKGIKVLAFVHETPEDIPRKFADNEPALREKLDAFRDKVQCSRLVKFWSETKELPGLVALSLNKTIKTYPAVGWVRANKITSEANIIEQNALLKEVEILRTQLEKFKASAPPSDIADIDEHFSVPLHWVQHYQGTIKQKAEVVDVSWRVLFAIIGPELERHPSDGAVNYSLGSALLRLTTPNHSLTVQVREDAFQTIRIQLAALGLISTVYTQSTKGEMVLFWGLTDLGKRMLFAWRTVKSAKIVQGEAAQLEDSTRNTTL